MTRKTNHHAFKRLKTNDQVEEENDDEQDDSDHQRYLSKLNKELTRQSPRTKRLLRLMRKTFEGRKKWTMEDRPSVAKVLDVFPPLKKYEQVSNILGYYITCTFVLFSQRSVVHYLIVSTYIHTR